MQEIFVNVLGIWFLILALATVGGGGKQFLGWSLNVVTHPLRLAWSAFWRNLGHYLLVLLIGVAFGVCNSHDLRIIFGMNP